jgi:hypothetical protein
MYIRKYNLLCIQMFARRMFALTSLSSIAHSAYPRRCHAETHKSVKCASYRDRFEQLNNKDKILVIEKYKNELTRTFGHSNIISHLPSDTVEQLHYILVLYSKPLSPERRIALRKTILPHLENSNGETQRFFEYILKYYDVL